MNGIAVLLTMAVIGVDYGWQPGKDGQLEYIVQIEPGLLDSLKNGAEIVSEIHPDARGVRRFRIRVGKDELPRVGQLAADTSPTRLSTSDIGNSRAGGRDSIPATGSFERSGSNLDPALLPGRNSGTPPSVTAPGILNLPPPPSLIGPDGKSSVLVRPGADDRAGFGISDPAMGSIADRANPVDDSRGWLNLPPPPDEDDAREVPGVGGQSPALSAPANNSPATSGRDYSLPATPFRWPPPANTAPGESPAGERRPVYPVPSPDTGTQVPVRGFGKHPDQGSLLERTAANDLLKSANSLPTVPSSRNPLPASKPELTNLAGNLEDARGAAAQKPAIDQATAEQLAEMQATRPWLPLVLTSLALFASLAANMYLGWIAIGIYRRYRDMVDQLHQAQTMLT